MAGSEAPYTVRLDANLDALGALVTDSLALRAPIAGTISRVSYTPEAAVTGAATNNRTIQLVNRGQAGSGNTVAATLTFGSGTNAAAYDETDLPLGVAANLAVAEGDVLEFRSGSNGTGIADPGGCVAITIAR